MKYLFLGCIVASLSVHAIDEKDRITPEKALEARRNSYHALGENGRVSAEKVEELRQMSCKIAFEKIFQNMADATDDKKTRITVLNNAEQHVYLAYEFISKHCRFIGGSQK